MERLLSRKICDLKCWQILPTCTPWSLGSWDFHQYCMKVAIALQFQQCYIWANILPLWVTVKIFYLIYNLYLTVFWLMYFSYLWLRNILNSCFYMSFAYVFLILAVFNNSSHLLITCEWMPVRFVTSTLIILI